MENTQGITAANETGIAGHLTRICQLLMAVSEQEQDPVKKREYFEEIFDQLSADTERLTDLVNAIDNEKMPENVQQISYHIDEPLVRSYIYFKEAIEYMVLFIDNEERRFIEQAMESIATGTEYLNIAEAGANQLKEVMKEHGDSPDENTDGQTSGSNGESGDNQSGLIDSLNKMTSGN